MERKTFIVIGAFGSGKWHWVEQKTEERKKPCFILDKIDTVDNPKERIQNAINSNFDVYIIETRIERIPKDILKLADEIIQK